MRTILLTACTFIFASAQAFADATVTVCSHNVEPGDARMDLAEAVKIGGRVTFGCAGVIPFTSALALAKDVEIDGEGKITLDGQGERMFGLGSSIAPHVNFKNIRIENAGTGSAGLPGSVVSGEGFVSFQDNTSISKSVKPVWILAGSASFQNTRLAGNTGPVVIVSEGDLEVSRNTTFTDSVGQSIATGPTVHARILDTQFFRNGGADFGGSKASSCKVVITNVWFANNTVAENGGALTTRCKLTMEDTQFENNVAGLEGGAVYLGIGASATMNKVRFRGNRASGSGGAIAAVWNVSQHGGLRIRHGRFDSNATAKAGGAIYTGEASLLDIGSSTFIGNSAPNAGGAIYVRQSALTVSNSLFLKNHTDSTGGAIASLCMPTKAGRIANTIVTENTAANGGAFYGTHTTFLNATLTANGDTPVQQGVACSDSSAIAFANTIIDGGSHGACAGGDATRIFKDLGHNLQFPAQTCGATITSAMPLLGMFLAPFVPFSPASSNGDHAVCMAAPINGLDIYGTHRPQGAGCSIGAVEGDLSQLVARFIKRHTVFDRK